MTTIIAGRFDVDAQVKRVIATLRAQDFTAEAIDTFFVNPPGQHDATSIGGDHDESAGATRADTTAMEGGGIGSAVGAAAGLAATPFLGPIAVAAGAGVGAYIGSLGGALEGMNSAGVHDDDKFVSRTRKGGLIVAVAVANTNDEQRAIAVLRGSGGKDVERAEGLWRNGTWADFDPLVVPREVSETALG
jgi:hypothetical protein